MDMSSLKEELHGFDGFAWPSRLGEKQKQRGRQMRAAARLTTVPEDTVPNEDEKQLPGQQAMSSTGRPHPKIHFTMYNKGPNFPRQIKLFSPKIVEIPVPPDATYAEMIAACQDHVAKLPGDVYRCDPGHIQGQIMMEVKDTEFAVDADCWDDVMQHLSGRSGAVAIFAYKVVGLPGCQERKRCTSLKRIVGKAVKFLSVRT